MKTNLTLDELNELITIMINSIGKLVNSDMYGDYYDMPISSDRADRIQELMDSHKSTGQGLEEAISVFVDKNPGVFKAFGIKSNYSGNIIYNRIPIHIRLTTNALV